MPVSDAIVEGSAVLPANTFDAANGWSLDTSQALDGGIVGGSSTYQNREGDLLAGYYDNTVQSYATKAGENNSQVNGERVATYTPGGTLSHLAAISKRTNTTDVNDPDELVITGRKPTLGEEPDAHYRGYYVADDGQNARISYFTAENGFPDGPPASWDLQSAATAENPDPLAFFGRVPAPVIGGHLSTRLRFSASFFRVRIVARTPSGARDNSNTAPREYGQTYNGKSPADFFEPQDLGATHRDIDSWFPAVGWTLEEGEAGADINGEIDVNSSRADTPGDIALSPSRAELDTMENFGFTETSVWQTAHFFDDANNDSRITNASSQQSPAHQVGSMGDFHEYILDVTPERIGYAVDGVYTFVIETPRPFREPKPVFVKRPGLSYLPDIDEDGNAKIVPGEIQRHADGSPRYAKHFTIANLVDGAKFVRAFAFNELTHPDPAKRAAVPTYNETDEVIIREWEMHPLAVDNPDAFSSARKGVLLPTTTTTGPNPRPPPPVCQAFRTGETETTVYAIPASDDVASFVVVKDGNEVATLANSPYVWVDSNVTGDHNYRTIAVNDSDVRSERSSQITITFTPPDTSPDPIDNPPILTVPDSALLEIGEDVPILIDVVDEVPATVVVTAAPDVAGIVEVIEATTDRVTVRGLAEGQAELAITARDESGQIVMDTVSVLVAATAKAAPLQAPAFNLTRPVEGTVRIDVVPADAVATGYQIRRNGTLITTLTGTERRYDDSAPGPDYRQYAVRAIATGQESGDAVRTIDLSTPLTPVEEIAFLDVFPPLGRTVTDGGGGNTLDFSADIAELRDRLDSVKDQPLLVFSTIDERDAYAETYSGLRSATLSGTWAIHDGSGWALSTKATVMSRVSGGQIYGTAPATTAAEREAIDTLLESVGRTFSYAQLDTAD